MHKDISRNLRTISPFTQENDISFFHNNDMFFFFFFYLFNFNFFKKKLKGILPKSWSITFMELRRKIFHIYETHACSCRLFNFFFCTMQDANNFGLQQYFNFNYSVNLLNLYVSNDWDLRMHSRTIMFEALDTLSHKVFSQKWWILIPLHI